MKPHSLLLAVGVCLAFALTANRAVGTAAQDTETDPVRVPNTFVKGEPARAGQVNANFVALEDGINANLTALAEVGERTEALETFKVQADGQFDALGMALPGLVDDLLETVEDVEALASAGASERLILVAPEKADHTSIGDALTAAAALSPAPTVVRVLPGTYDTTETLVVPGFVHLQGTSSAATILRGSLSGNLAAGAVLVLEEGARVSSIAVQNLGTGAGNSTAIFADGTSRATLLEDVWTLPNEAGGDAHRALNISGGSLTVRRCNLDGRGAALDSAAILVNNDGTSPGALRIEDSQLDADGRTLRGFAAQLEVVGSLLNSESDDLVVQLLGNSFGRFAATQFVGGQVVADGTSSAQFVQCWKSNFDPVLDGIGSTVLP